MSEQIGHTVYYAGMPDSRKFVTIQIEPPLDDAEAAATKRYMEEAVSSIGSGNIVSAVHLVQSERTRLFIEVGESGGLTPKGIAAIAASAIHAMYGGRTVLAEFKAAEHFSEADQ